MSKALSLSRATAVAGFVLAPLLLRNENKKKFPETGRKQAYETGEKRARRHGAAPLGGGLPSSMRAAAVRTLGRTADPNERLPQAPNVAAQRRTTTQRWRERQRARDAAAAQTAA